MAARKVSRHVNGAQSLLATDGELCASVLARCPYVSLVVAQFVCKLFDAVLRDGRVVSHRKADGWEEKALLVVAGARDNAARRGIVKAGMVYSVEADDMVYGDVPWQLLNFEQQCQDATPCVDTDGTVWRIGGYDAVKKTPIPTTFVMYRASRNNLKWAKKTGPRLAKSRFGAVAGNINGALIVAGGFDTLKSVTNSCEILPRAADEWIPAPDMPVAVANAGSAVHDGRLIVVGGEEMTEQNGSCVVQLFHIASQVWVRVNDLPYARCVPRVIGRENYVILFGGTSCVLARTTSSR